MKKSRATLRPLIVTLLALVMVFGLSAQFAVAQGASQEVTHGTMQGATGRVGIDFLMPEFTVTFIRNWNDTDNTVVGTPLTVPWGTIISANNIPEPGPNPPHHIFNGWALNRDGQTPFVAGHRVTGNINVYAQWEPERFTVTFNPRGGTINNEEVLVIPNVVYRTPLQFPGVPVHEYAIHVFMGWFCRETGLQFRENDNWLVDRDMIFDAFWSPFIRFVAENGEFNLATFNHGPGLVFHRNADNSVEVRIDLDSRGGSTFFLSEGNQIPHNNYRPPEEYQVRPVGFNYPDYRLVNWYRQYENGAWRDERHLEELGMGLAFGTRAFTSYDRIFEPVTIDGVNHLALTVYSRWRRAIPFVPDWPPAWYRGELINVDVDGGDTRLHERQIDPPPDEGFYSHWYFVGEDGSFLGRINLELEFPNVPAGSVRAVERRQIPVMFDAGSRGTLANDQRYVEFTPWADGGATIWPFHDGSSGVTDFTLSDLRYDNVYSGNFEIPQNPTRDDGRAFLGWRWQRANTQPISRFRIRSLFSPAAMHEQMFSTADIVGLTNTGTPRDFLYNDDADAMHEQMLAIDLSFYMNRSYVTEFVAIWEGDPPPGPGTRPPTPGRPTPETRPPVTPGDPTPETRPPGTPGDTDDADEEETEYDEHQDYQDEDDRTDDTAPVLPGEPPPAPPGPPGGRTDIMPPTDGLPFAGSWALLNLIMTLLCVVGFLAFTVSAVLSKQHSDDDYEARSAETDTKDGEELKDSDRTRRRVAIPVIASGILALAAAVLFIITQNMQLPMVMSDRWTGIHLTLLAVMALVFLIRIIRRDQSDSEVTEECEKLRVEN